MDYTKLYEANNLKDKIYQLESLISHLVMIPENTVLSYEFLNFITIETEREIRNNILKELQKKLEELTIEFENL